MESGRFLAFARRLFHYNGALAAAARKAAEELEPDPGPIPAAHGAASGPVRHVDLTHPSLSGLIEMR